MKKSELPPGMLEKIEKANPPRQRPVDVCEQIIATGIAPVTEANKTELAYRDRLERMKAAGKIVDYRPHPFSLKLAKDFHYRPDFVVVELDRSLTIVETKGGWIEEDSIVKFKAAKALLPFFRFRMEQYKKGEWTTIRELA